MVATALAFKLQKEKSITAINNFISTVTYDDERRRKFIPRESADLAKMHKEIAKSISKYSDEEIVLIKERLNIKEIVNTIIETYNKNYQFGLFLEKCKRIKVLIIFALLFGIVCSIVSVLFRNVIDAYLFCFLVWDLSCLSLLVTLELIIKDWKDNQYGKKNKH